MFESVSGGSPPNLHHPPLLSHNTLQCSSLIQLKLRVVGKLDPPGSYVHMTLGVEMQIPNNPFFQPTPLVVYCTFGERFHLNTAIISDTHQLYDDPQKCEMYLMAKRISVAHLW